MPLRAVFGLGSTTTAAIRNNGVVIDHNNIFDFFSPTSSVSGIHVLSGNDVWTISNNRIFHRPRPALSRAPPCFATRASL
jgi:hypothetical protein